MNFQDKPIIKKVLLPSLISSCIIICLAIPLVVFFIISYISIISSPYTSFPWWMWIPLIIILLIIIVPACIILINEIAILRSKSINNEQIRKLNSRIFKSSICCIIL